MSWLEDLEAAYGVEPDPGFGPPTVDVESAAWAGALQTARDDLRCTLFDFLTAVDALDEGFWVVAHVAAHHVGSVDHLLIRTRIPSEPAEIACVCDVYPGAGWHERETHEMFGIGFTGHDPMSPLLLPDGFEGHPLRKDFVLASRVAKSWPGAKEPGESEHDAAPSRRRMRPPGVPDPETWPLPETGPQV